MFPDKMLANAAKLEAAGDVPGWILAMRRLHMAGHLGRQIPVSPTFHLQLESSLDESGNDVIAVGGLLMFRGIPIVAREGASMVTLEAREAIRNVIVKRRAYDALGEQQSALNDQLKEASRQEDAAIAAVARVLPKPENGSNIRYVLVDGDLFQLMYRAYQSDNLPAVTVTQLPLEA